MPLIEDTEKNEKNTRQIQNLDRPRDEYGRDWRQVLRSLSAFYVEDSFLIGHKKVKFCRWVYVSEINGSLTFQFGSKGAETSRTIELITQSLVVSEKPAF